VLPQDTCLGTWPDGPFTAGSAGERAGAQLLGEFVRQVMRARRERGWSRRELAAQTSLRPNTVGDIEAGRSWPDLRTVAVLADTLAIPVSFTPTPEPPGPPETGPLGLTLPGPRVTVGAVIHAILNYSPSARAEFMEVSRRGGASANPAAAPGR
jgi:transcriptional regulator with XRE-family HTH domain